jgi:hypothetical protein
MEWSRLVVIANERERANQQGHRRETLTFAFDPEESQVNSRVILRVRIEAD